MRFFCGAVGVSLRRRWWGQTPRRNTVLPYGRATFSSGADYAVSSTSAFVAGPDLDELVRLADLHCRQLIIPAGALGGVDALAAASRLGIDCVIHRITKPALAWRGTAAETVCELTALECPTVFFEGSAADAAARFPQNANVAVISSIAGGIGLDRTRVVLVADPGAAINEHLINASGAFGELEVRLKNRALASNAKSSEMTALNLIRMIENRAKGLVI